MRTLCLLSAISLSGFLHLQSKPINLFSCLFSSSSICISSPTQTSMSIPNRNPNHLVINYLIDSFGISKTRANEISKRFSWIKSPEKPQSVVNYLQKLGFTQPQIRSSFNVSPQMLFAGIEKTLRPKLEFFQQLGFVGSDLEDECMEMFRRAPGLPRVSEEKLKLGIEFFMNTIKFNKSSLVRHPTFLMFSMENRVIPRYKVLQLIKSKRLLNKEPSYTNVLFYLTEEEFLEKFISRFIRDAEELLIAYKGHLLDSADK